MGDTKDRFRANGDGDELGGTIIWTTVRPRVGLEQLSYPSTVECQRCIANRQENHQTTVRIPQEYEPRWYDQLR
jgi:hypothetical protein